MERWSGKVAIVTGASAGIGADITKALVQNGIRVVALARREDKLQELIKTLKDAEGSVYPVKCDVRREEDIVNAFRYAEEHLGGVDILVNNAGIIIFEPITEGSTANFRAILEVNILAPAIAIREAVMSMRKHGAEGHIININSYLGRYATAGPGPMGLYQASKYALRAMTENVRKEFKLNRDNIKITGIHPGLVKTDILDAAGEDPSLFERQPHIRSQDVTDAVVFALRAEGNVEVNEVMVAPLYE